MGFSAKRKDIHRDLDAALRAKITLIPLSANASMKKAGFTGQETGVLGIEPRTVACHDTSQSDQLQIVSDCATVDQKQQKTKYVTKCAQEPTISPELEALIERWDTLPEHRRRTILDLAGLGNEA